MIKSKNFAGLLAVSLLSACGRPDGGTDSVPPANATPAASEAHPLPKSDTEFLDGIVASGQTLGWMKTLKTLHPAEYQRLNAKLEPMARRSTDMPAERLAMAREVEPFMREQKQQLGRAPDRELKEWLRRSTTVAERLLKEDPQACTDVFQGRLDPAIQLPDATWAAMSDATEQLLIAAQEAKVRPQTRELSPLELADVVEWREEMKRRGASDEMFAILSDPARKAAATPYELCQTRIAMMEAAQHLRPNLTAKIVLALLSSAKPASGPRVPN
jgi:hypothetical protein